MEEFIPEKVMIIRHGKELRIVALQNRKIYIFLRLPKDIDAMRYFERLRIRYRKDKKRNVQIVQTMNAKKSIGDFISPVRDLYYRVVMGKRIRLRKEE